MSSKRKQKERAGDSPGPSGARTTDEIEEAEAQDTDAGPFGPFPTFREVADVWRHIGASPIVLSWIKHGVHIKFSRRRAPRKWHAHHS